MDWASEATAIYSDFEQDGFAVTVTALETAGIYDRATDSYADPSDPVEYSTFGILNDYDQKDIDGTTVKAEDKILLIPTYGKNASGDLVALPDLTESNATISIGGRTQNVQRINAKKPGNVTIFYQLQVRT